MTSQFLINGIQKFKEKGIFVSLEESKDHYEDEMNTFGWDLESLDKAGQIYFIDASPIRAIPENVKIGNISISKSDFSLVSLLEIIKNRAISTGVERIVVDPASHLIFQYSDDTKRRKALLDLVDALSKTGATCLLSSELMEVGGSRRRLQLEEYIAHGVILMQTYTVANEAKKRRKIQVVKMRGSHIDLSPRPYDITEKGIEVYSGEPVLES